MVMATLVPRYTAAEVRKFDDPRLRFEVIRGELFVTPGPGSPHQIAVVKLARWLDEYLEAQRLGIVLTGPFEVLFTKDSAVQPDVIAVLDAERRQLTRRRLNGPPALAIEVVSFSSKRTDRLQKRLLYQEEGVPEYWIVDLGLRQVERWRPGDAEPTILRERLTWRPAGAKAPLEMDLAALFRACEV